MKRLIMVMVMVLMVLIQPLDLVACAIVGIVKEFKQKGGFIKYLKLAMRTKKEGLLEACHFIKIGSFS